VPHLLGNHELLLVERDGRLEVPERRVAVAQATEDLPFTFPKAQLPADHEGLLVEGRGLLEVTEEKVGVCQVPQCATLPRPILEEAAGVKRHPEPRDTLARSQPDRENTSPDEGVVAAQLGGEGVTVVAGECSGRPALPLADARRLGVEECESL